MNSFLKTTAIVCLSLMPLPAWTYGFVYWQTTIGYSDFKHIQPKLYVDPALSKASTQRLLDLITQAKQRIETTFGEYTANPIIIVTATEEHSNTYGLGHAPATAFALPWEEYVVIGHQAQNVDVIAHELVHAELRHQLGYWRYMRELPTWLDEGAAMQVDWREKYDLTLYPVTQSEKQAVKQLTSPSQFWTTQQETIQHYRAAKTVVAETLHQHPRLSLKHLIELFEISPTQSQALIEYE